jgi:hypothetical protein
LHPGETVTVSYLPNPTAMPTTTPLGTTTPATTPPLPLMVVTNWPENRNTRPLWIEDHRVKKTSNGDPSTPGSSNNVHGGRGKETGPQ